MARSGSFPAPVPFAGKPRTAQGDVVDWVALHLSPPDPDAFHPPRWHRHEEDDDAAAPIEFLPAQQPEPVLLSAAELARYNADGFLLRPGGGIPVLTATEVETHRRVWQEIFDAHCEADPQGVNGFFKRYGGAYDLVSHPVVVQLAQDILGPRCCCWGAHYMCKPKGDATATPLGFSADGSPAHHQDGLGWPFRSLASTTVWLALDDVGDDNGPMLVYPGSHRHGVVDCSSQHAVEARCGAGVAIAPVAAGSASLHCDLVVHSSPPSVSNHRRKNPTRRIPSIVSGIPCRL